MLRFAMHKLVLVVSVVALTGLGVVALSAAPAGAVPGVCNGTVSGVITSGLVVHGGDNCDVENAIVAGGIRMDGGTLRVCNSAVSGGVVVSISSIWVYDENSSWVNIGNDELDCAGNSLSGGVRVSGVDGYIPGEPNESQPTSSVEFENNQIAGGLVVTNNRFVEIEANFVSPSCFASNNGGVSSFEGSHPNIYAGSNVGCPV